MRKIHVIGQFFEASNPKGHFFRKNGKLVYRFSLGDCVYQFLFGQGAEHGDIDKAQNTDIYTTK